MARIIHTGDTPAKKRHAHMRSCAEVLRLLAQRSTFDEEAEDMTAFFALTLREIHRIIDNSAQVWDDRNYWKKAEHLRHKWRWTAESADRLEALIREDRWEQVPAALIALAPHFSSITVTAITRDADWWCGAKKALLQRKHSTSSR